MAHAMVWPVLYAYFGIFGAVLFLLLFGEAEMFEGTIVERAHYYMTEGCCLCGSFVARRALGEARGVRLASACDEWLCNRPNPAMQLVYLALVMGGYAAYWTSVYDLVGTFDKLSIPILMFTSISTWLVVCWSDPGAITAENYEAMAAAYPHDETLFHPIVCKTLGVVAPARSKYCRVTKRRIARFDHFCGWMNNSIGENNLRYFVSFLAIHVVMCAYAGTVALSCVRNEISRRGLWDVGFEGKDGTPTKLTEDYALFARFALWHFAPILGLAAFLYILVIALGAFLGYHLWMISKGMTTNETFKWQSYKRALKHLAMERAAEGGGDGGGGGGGGGDDDDDAVKDAMDAMEDEDVGCAPAVGGGGGGGGASDGGGGFASRIPGARYLGFARKKKNNNKSFVMPPVVNKYDKGFRTNLHEVFFPLSFAAQRRIDEEKRAAKKKK